MIVQMRCCHLKHKGETWALDLGDERAEIRDAGGNVRAQFTRDEAAHQFLMPSFSESIKQFRAPVDGELWYFDVAKPDLKEIKAYIDRAVVAAGPEAISAVRSQAIRDTLLGVGGVVLGAGLTIASYMKAAEDPEGGRYVVTYGLIVVGLAMIGKGVYGFVRHGRLQKMAQAPEGGATPSS